MLHPTLGVNYGPRPSRECFVDLLALYQRTAKGAIPRKYRRRLALVFLIEYNAARQHSEPIRLGPGKIWKQQGFGEERNKRPSPSLPE
jgi:hypothetical protein